MFIYWIFKSNKNEKTRKNIVDMVPKYETKLGVLNIQYPKYKQCHSLYKSAYFDKSYSIIFIKYAINRMRNRV